MGQTTFSGPVKAGTIREGSSANVGFTYMTQTANWTQSTTAADTGIIIPANSQITEIKINITTATTAANISIGTTSAANELFTALAAGTAANVFKYGTLGTHSDTSTWANVGSSDVSIFIDFSAGTAGAGFITVEYIQGINNVE
tara:strand:+ start:68 stop:499 length:432 start_codon:yes stop_codon:yes gene_type:complete